MDEWTFKELAKLYDRVGAIEEIIGKEFPNYLENDTRATEVPENERKERHVEEHKSEERK